MEEKEIKSIEMTKKVDDEKVEEKKGEMEKEENIEETKEKTFEREIEKEEINYLMKEEGIKVLTEEEMVERLIYFIGRSGGS